MGRAESDNGGSLDLSRAGGLNQPECRVSPPRCRAYFYVRLAGKEIRGRPVCRTIEKASKLIPIAGNFVGRLVADFTAQISIRQGRLLFAIALLFSASPVSAGDYHLTLRSGVSEQVHHYFAFNADCTFKPFDIEIISPPLHGSVVPIFGERRISNQNVHIGRPGRCIGMPIRAATLTYRSKAGFSGNDRFTATMTILGSGNGAAMCRS